MKSIKYIISTLFLFCIGFNYLKAVKVEVLSDEFEGRSLDFQNRMIITLIGKEEPLVNLKKEMHL